LRSHSGTDLVRAIGTTRLTASVVNATVGAGIFVLPATVAAEIGRSAVLAYLVCGAVMGLVSLCVAAAGSRVDSTGGIYAYVDRAFGRGAGFAGGAIYWVASALSAAAVASALFGSLSVVMPAIGATGGRTLGLVLLYCFLAWINRRGVGSGAGLVTGLTVAKLLPLFLLVAGGLRLVQPEAALAQPIPEANDLGRASLILIFAFLGLEIAVVPSGEITDPPRTVPRALFLALGLTTALYVAVQTVAQAVLGDSLAIYAEAPLAEAASRLFGDAGRALVMVGGMVSMLGYVSGDMLSTPRALFAMAQKRLLPASLAVVHDGYRTPSHAIVVHAAIVCILAATGTFRQLVILTSAATLVLYLMAVAAAWKLQRHDLRDSGRPFVLPGGPIIPAVAAACLLWLLAQTSL
jgi:basic amino acid/polyamine antiporter, APA family